jgi:glycosyltransferase involved in cell wall biosynthesis
MNKKPKTFTTVTSLPMSKKAIAVAAISYKLLVDKSVTLCDYTRRTMEKWGVNHNEIVTIPLFAPDLQWFDSAQSRNVSVERYGIQQIERGKHTPVIIYAARHSYEKGFSYYLQAAKKVLETFDCLFIVGGQGPITENLKGLAKRLGIKNHVLFTGWISNYHMPYILSRIPDICVSASLREQFPSYVLECMAARKPVIAAKVGGVPEAVEDGVNGYLVPPREPNVLSNKIIRLIEEPKEAKKMGEEGRKIVKQRFNMETAAADLSKVYEMVTH